MSGRPFYINIRNKLSQFFNPALCITCGIPIAPPAHICEECVITFERVKKPCESCGLPNPIDDPICPSCLHQPPLWQAMRAPYVYRDTLRELIQKLKFNEQLSVANALVTHSHHLFDPASVDALIPVPLHISRLLQRGFNQAEEIALALGRHLNLPVDRSSLIRVKETSPQSGLSMHYRKRNILKAFRFENHHRYQSVALVDDIITSGSTMHEISKCLHQSGVKHIEVWSLARALKHD